MGNKVAMGEENDNDRLTAELQARVVQLEVGLASACARIEKLERLGTSTPKRKKRLELVWEEDAKSGALRASTGDGKEYVISQIRIKICLGNEKNTYEGGFNVVYRDRPAGKKPRRIGNVPTQGEAKALAETHHAKLRR
jgi:hypothetical protein